MREGGREGKEPNENEVVAKLNSMEAWNMRRSKQSYKNQRPGKEVEMWESRRWDIWGFPLAASNNAIWKQSLLPDVWYWPSHPLLAALAPALSLPLLPLTLAVRTQSWVTPKLPAEYSFFSIAKVLDRNQAMQAWPPNLGVLTHVCRIMLTGENFPQSHSTPFQNKFPVHTNGWAECISWAGRSSKCLDE